MKCVCVYTYIHIHIFIYIYVYTCRKLIRLIQTMINDGSLSLNCQEKWVRYEVETITSWRLIIWFTAARPDGGQPRSE